MTTPSITPYDLSLFGKTYTAFAAMQKAADNPAATIDELRAAWATLQPSLSKHLFCRSDDGAIIMSEGFIEMAPSSAYNLPAPAAETWDRLRVLQGLTYHLQLWLLVTTHWVVTHPDSHDLVAYNTRSLMLEIHEAMCSNDAIEESEQWMDNVIETAQQQADNE